MFLGNKLNSIKWLAKQTRVHFEPVNSFVWHILDAGASAQSYVGFYLNLLILPYASVTSILGFLLLQGITMQLLSGFFLAWYYVPEPSMVCEFREEMFIDTAYGFEIFQLHVRGVDFLMLLSYAHIFKKIYLKNYINTESDGWMLGGYAFLWFHYIIGLGISLSATWLSDVTVTIMANMFWSILNNVHKSYYIIFTNKHLNVDQMTRLSLLHYFSPWYYTYLIKLHVMFCHESWDSDSSESVYEDRSATFIAWFYDAFLKEFQDASYWAHFAFLYFYYHHSNVVQIAFFYFEHWNIVMAPDPNFFIVAPHWYFRPLMGLLVVSPSHYEGLGWMAGFFLLLATMPILYGFYGSNTATYAMQTSWLQTVFFLWFLLSLLCTTLMLPCGRYYYDIEAGYVGNPWVKMSYQYIYLYLGWLVYHLDAVEAYFKRRTEAYVNAWNVKLGRYCDEKLRSRAWFGSKPTIRDGKKVDQTK